MRVVPRAAELAAGVTVPVVRAGALSEPVDLASAARHRRVAADAVEAVWAAMWQLAAPTAGVLRIPAAQLARRAGASVAQVNRVIPLLRDFGLISRRGRRRGAWTTTIHALVDAAASDQEALAAVWEQPAGPQISAATRREAHATGRLSAHAPAGSTACGAPRPCDLSAVADVVAPIVGVQVRNHSWQGDMAAALELGWSPQQLATELTRDLDDARDARRVCRHRLMVIIGRVPARHRHCCGQWVPPQPPPGHGDRHQPPWLTHQPAASPTADVTPAVRREPADVEAVAPTVASTVAHNPGEPRTTVRKESKNTDAPPPQTPPTGGEQALKKTPTPSTTRIPAHVVTFSEAIVADAIAILSLQVPASARTAMTARLAAQLDLQHGDPGDEQLRLNLTLGLVGGTAGTRDPARVLGWRVAHPLERTRVAARYRAAGRAVGGTQLGEPGAAAAFALHEQRLAATAAERSAHTLERNAALTAAAAEQARVARLAAAEQDQQARQARDAQAAQLRRRAQQSLGRVLGADASAWCSEIAGLPAAAVAAMLRRKTPLSQATIEDLVALFDSAGIAGELLQLPSIVFPAGPLRAGVAALVTPSGPRHGPLTRAVLDGEAAPTRPATAAQGGQADAADIDAALAAAGVPGRRPAAQRRAWGAWLIDLRTIRLRSDRGSQRPPPRAPEL